MKGENKVFGITKDGEEVRVYTLKNEFLEVEILNYGGIIRKIATSDKSGKKENIVLSFDNLESYEENSAYLGCITGRVAGRIEKGVFKIKDEEYQLENNSGENHIHGGSSGLNKKVWKAVYLESDKKKILNLTYHSKHLEEGYPGNVTFEVAYTLFEDTLTIDYLGIPDRDTYINLTNHTYFNLSGDYSEDIKSHHLKISSDKYISVSKDGLPSKLVEMKDAVIDFRSEKELKDILDSDDSDVATVGGGIDHPFILNDESEYSCTLFHDKTKRKITVKTDQPVIVVYTGNFLEGINNLSGNTISKKHLGIALETQDYTNIFKAFPDKVKLHTPLYHYKQHTVFQFTVEK